jgi:hypothetical protein
MSVDSQIKDIKKLILTKKIMLNILIDRYSFLENLLKWGHTLIAFITPFMATLEVIIGSDNKIIGTITIIFSCIVAGMIKVREYLEYDKIRDLSKSQTVKYRQLYSKIIKEENKKQLDDFIYWMNQEYNNIELTDPEFTVKEREIFRNICKEKGIPYDNDINTLELLVKTDNVANPVEQAKVEQETKMTEEHHPKITYSPDRKKKYKNTLSRLDTRTESDWINERLKDL